MASGKKTKKDTLVKGLLSKPGTSLASDFRADFRIGRLEKAATPKPGRGEASPRTKPAPPAAKPVAAPREDAFAPAGPESRQSGQPKRAAKKNHRSPKKLNVLVTGVTTSIGRNLVMHLMNNRKVGVVLGVAQPEKPYYFNDLPPEKFIYRKCDILKYRQLKNLFLSQTFRQSEINAVVHLAFNNRPIRGEDIHRLNVEGTRDLLKQCLEREGITKFVFKSSDVVYKLTPHNPIFLDENAPLNFDPDVDQWIKDRVDADMICRSFMDNGRVKIVILRMTNIIGRNVAAQFNSYFDSRPVIKTMGFNPLGNLLHMKDVIEAINLALFKNVQGIYNIAGRDTAPITTFVNLNGRRLVSIPEPLMPVVNWAQRKLGLTRYYYSVDKERQKYTALLDISKAARELDYQPKGRVEFEK